MVGTWGSCAGGAVTLAVFVRPPGTVLQRNKRSVWAEAACFHRCSPLTALLLFVQVPKTIDDEQHLCRVDTQLGFNADGYQISESLNSSFGFIFFLRQKSCVFTWYACVFQYERPLIWRFLRGQFNQTFWCYPIIVQMSIAKVQLIKTSCFDIIIITHDMAKHLGCYDLFSIVIKLLLLTLIW